MRFPQCPLFVSIQIETAQLTLVVNNATISLRKYNYFELCHMCHHFTYLSSLKKPKWDTVQLKTIFFDFMLD